MKFLFFLACIFASIGFANTVFESGTSARVTALLLELRVEEAKAAFESEQSLLDSAAIQEYVELFDRLSPASVPADSAQQRSVGSMAAQMQDRFRIPTAGPAANTAYNHCMNAFTSGDLRSCVLYYRLAIFFKGRFIFDERIRLRTRYRAARKSFTQGEYLLAKLQVDSVITSEAGNPEFGELKDSLWFLQRQIEETISNINAEQRKHHSQETFNYTAGLSIGVAPMYTTMLHDVQWILKTRGDGVLFYANVGAIHPSYGYTAALQVRLHYSPSLSQLIRYETGGITFSAVDMNGQKATIALNHSITTYSTLLRYYFSEKTGLRSFVSAGAGKFSVQRDEQNIYIADFLIGTGWIKLYSLPGESMTSAKLSAEWGLEYNTGTLSRYYLEGTLGLHYLTASKKIISPIYSALLLTAGVLL